MPNFNVDDVVFLKGTGWFPNPRDLAVRARLVEELPSAHGLKVAEVNKEHGLIRLKTLGGEIIATSNGEMLDARYFEKPGGL